MALGEVIFGQNPVKEALLQNKRDEFSIFASMPEGELLFSS
jgi:hypothetical protein